MPIYEYACSDCGLKFEKLVMRQNQEINCPDCSKANVKRLMSACNFGSSDGSVQPAVSQSSCSSCTSTNCSSCSSGGH